MGSFLTGFRLTWACVFALVVAVRGQEAIETVDDAAREAKDLLEKLANLSNPSVSGPEEQQKAIALIHQYVAVLKVRDYAPTVTDLQTACDLPILHVPDARDGLDGHQTNLGLAEESDLPINALDLVGQILDHCRRKELGDDARSKELADRLQAKLLEYDAYQRADVLDAAAALYRRHAFPGEAPVSLSWYVRFLRCLPPGNGVSRRVVRDSYWDVEGDLEQGFRALSQQPMETRERFLAAWRELRMLLVCHLDVGSGVDCERGNTTTVGCDCDVEAFRRWEQRQFGEAVAPALREVLSLESSTKERLELGLTLAGGVKAERGLNAVLTQLHRFGLTPEDAITANRRPTRANPWPYGVGPCSTIFLDVYRGAMGDDSLADVYTRTSQDSANRAVQRRTFRRNCASVFLAVLQGLSANGDETVNACIGELMFLAAQGMRAEVARMSEIPDMDEWGERAALYLGVGDGSNLDERRWLDAKRKVMKQIVLSGFPRLNSQPAGEDEERVCGVFVQFSRRLPEALADKLEVKTPQRRAQIGASELYNSALSDGRQQFIRSFLRAAQRVKDAEEILCQWGFM